MPYIKKSPVGDGFHKMDNLTASATDNHTSLDDVVWPTKP